MGAQAVALAVLVSVVGMPHGGLDHRVGRALLRPTLGPRWAVAFAALYLGAMAVVVLGWYLAPLPTLAGFVLLSAVHFGTADAQPGAPGGLARAALLGGMVVWVPALFQPAEFTRLLTWVVPGDRWPEPVLFAPQVRTLLWAALAAVCASQCSGAVPAAARTLGFVALYALAPPLVGFVVYFCGWHSAAELVRLARRAAPGRPAAGLWRVVAAAAPLSALAVAMGAVGWALAGDLPLAPGLVRVVFVGLSVVAVPHLLLNLVAARADVNPFAAEGNG